MDWRNGLDGTDGKNWTNVTDGKDRNGEKDESNGMNGLDGVSKANTCFIFPYQCMIFAYLKKNLLSKYMKDEGFLCKTTIHFVQNCIKAF